MSGSKQWDELEELFNTARELAPMERESLLAAHSLDPDVRRKLDELLSANDALEASGDTGFLASLDPLRASNLLDVATSDQTQPAQLSPGDTVGRYRIVRPIGRGGMGVIYLASDPRLNRSVALKLLPPHLSVDTNARRRFEEEARAASLLDHANIATVYEVDETADGRLFIAMAYYEGKTLREKLGRGSLPTAEIISLAAQVAAGLKAAHAAGLVHRDIKPGNVIVTPQGVAKIVDFGIARIATDEITQNGLTAGTVAYMSPEQTRGAPPNPSMDVWSFGVMLYEMLTGIRPFAGDRDEIVIFAIRNDEPRPVEQLLSGSVPPKLVEIVQKCLRKNVNERYPDAGAVITDLRKLPDSGLDTNSLESTRPISERAAPAENRRASPRRYMVAAIATLAILIGGSVWISRNEIARGAATVPHSIAVLPFDETNASGDDHFSAGLADELITALGAMPGLKVAARTSTFALYASGNNVKSIADSLGVATILEGSVRRDTARLRISARLVQARDNAVLWSEAYDVPMRDVFSVQEQIARSIADALNVRLMSNVHDSPLVAKPTADLEAYDLYLRGRHVRSGDTKDRLEQALAYFREAIDRDPNFANAYSGLAETYVNLANFRIVTPVQGFSSANIAAMRALKLNPRLAEAYTSHAYVLASLREFDRAEGSFRRALELNPNFPLSHHYYSLLLAMLGRTDESLEQNRRARELDPLFAPAAAEYGIILCQRGELAAADSQLSSTLTLEPKFALTLYWLGAVRAAEGSYPAARQSLERAARASPDYPGVLGALAYVYTRTGMLHAADSIVATLRAHATDDSGRANLAFAYAALDKRDAAFVLLNQLDWDVPSLIGLRADPLLKSLRSDPRYAVLLNTITRPTHPAQAQLPR
jgi:serine/threonine-protein kinase